MTVESIVSQSSIIYIRYEGSNLLCLDLKADPRDMYRILHWLRGIILRVTLQGRRIITLLPFQR